MSFFLDHNRKPHPKKLSKCKQVLVITGLESISFNLNENWKTRIISLCIEAHIPAFYISAIVSPEYYVHHPNTVFVYFLNKYCKNKSKIKLKILINKTYNNTIYVM